MTHVRRPMVLFALTMILSALLLSVFRLPPLGLGIGWMIVLCGFVTAKVIRRRQKIVWLIVLLLICFLIPHTTAFLCQYSAERTLKNLDGVREYEGVVTGVSKSTYAVTVYARLSDGERPFRVVFRSRDASASPELYDTVSLSAKLLPLNTGNAAEAGLYPLTPMTYYAKNTYLTAKASSVSLSQPQTETLTLFEKTAYSIREKLKRYMTPLFDVNTASYASSLLIGDRVTLEDAVNERFRLAGLAPLLCISGLHILILLGVFNLLMRFLPIKPAIRFGIGILFCLFLMMITGAGGSVIRASLMAILVFGASLFRRKNDVYTSLSAACLVLLCVNPFCVFDIGVRLSFLATLGVIDGAALSRYFLNGEVLPQYAGRVIDSLILSVYAVSYTAYIVADTFGYLSVVSPFSNLLSGIVFVPLMYTLVLTMLLSLTPLYGLTAGMAFLSRFLIVLLDKLAGLFAAIPFAYTEVTPFPFFGMVFGSLLVVHLIALAFCDRRIHTYTSFLLVIPSCLYLLLASSGFVR